MTKLVEQPTKFPTRKILAVIASGAILGGINAGLTLLWPDHPFAVVLEEADTWIQLTVMALAGYMTKEKENVG
jgi:hypothetical protein